MAKLTRALVHGLRSNNIDVLTALKQAGVGSQTKSSGSRGLMWAAIYTFLGNWRIARE